jgi:uncharacterized protein
MISYKDKWALITGASAGIGEEFARSLARFGANLILTARREEKLRSLAEELRTAHNIRVEIIVIDLSLADSPQKLFSTVQVTGHPVRILVNNAGFGVYGKLNDTQLEQNQRMIMLNVYALSSLTQLFLPDMVAAGEGYIFNIASTAAFQPVAYMSNYGASKAFVLSFSEALWAEYRKSGVRALAVCPGATETEFFNVMGTKEPAIGKQDSPQNVVFEALCAMDHGRSYVIAGPWMNYAMAQSVRLSPRALVAKITEMMMKPRKK